jgi:hypothetical protein
MGRIRKWIDELFGETNAHNCSMEQFHQGHKHGFDALCRGATQNSRENRVLPLGPGKLLLQAIDLHALQSNLIAGFGEIAWQSIEGALQIMLAPLIRNRTEALRRGLGVF